MGISKLLSSFNFRQAVKEWQSLKFCLNGRILVMKKITATLLFFIWISVCFSQIKKDQSSISEPENISAKINFDKKTGRIQLIYEDKVIADFHLKAANRDIRFDQVVDTLDSNHALTQTLNFSGGNLDVRGLV